MPAKDGLRLNDLRRIEQARPAPPCSGIVAAVPPSNEPPSCRGTLRPRAVNRIGGKIRPKNLLDLAAKRSPFHVHPGSHWWMCAHAERRTEDQTWHFAKRVTPPNTTSQRRRKWRRKSANSCAATS